MAVQSENERNKAAVDEYVAPWGGGFPIKVNGEVVGVIVSAALALIPDWIPEK
jgi:uncharacterized protein (UPF0303 family)